MTAETHPIENTSEETEKSSEKSDAASPPRRRTLWQGIVLRLQITFWLMLIYSLSLGPMYWIWYESKYIGGSPWVAVFYEPLLRLTVIPVFRDWINWYLSYWG